MYHFLDLKLKIILPHDSPISVPKMTPLGTLTDDEIDDEYTVLILYLILKNLNYSCVRSNTYAHLNVMNKCEPYLIKYHQTPN